jgi:hypothetical protein
MGARVRAGVGFDSPMLDSGYMPFGGTMLRRAESAEGWVRSGCPGCGLE